MGWGGKKEEPSRATAALPHLFFLAPLLIALASVLLVHGALSSSQAPRGHREGGGGCLTHWPSWIPEFSHTLGRGIPSSCPRQTTRSLVKGRLKVRVDKQAFGSQQHGLDSRFGCPVPLEQVDPNLIIGVHILVERSQEVALGQGVQKVFPKKEFHAQQVPSGPSMVTCLLVSKVVLDEKDLDAPGRVSSQRHQPTCAR